MGLPYHRECLRFGKVGLVSFVSFTLRMAMCFASLNHCLCNTVSKLTVLRKSHRICSISPSLCSSFCSISPFFGTDWVCSNFCSALFQVLEQLFFIRINNLTYFVPMFQFFKNRGLGKVRNQVSLARYGKRKVLQHPQLLEIALWQITGTCLF